MATTVPGQIPTQNINGLTYYQSSDGEWYDGRGVPLQQETPDYAGGSQFEQGVTAQDLINPTITNHINPLQLATQQTADSLSQFGPVGQTTLAGEGQPTTPIRSVGGQNAGLVQDTINRYGPATPGSYSEYLIKRDQQQDPGSGDYSTYNNYYNSAPVKEAIKAAATQPGVANNNPVPPGTGGTTYTGGIGQGTPGPGYGTPTGPIVPTGRGSGAAWGAPAVTPPPGSGNTIPPVIAQPSTPSPGGGTVPPGGGTAPPSGGAVRPPFRPPTRGPGIPGGSAGSAQAPNANYQPRTTPSFRSNPTNAYANVSPMYTQQDTPEPKNKGEGLQYKTENDRALALQRGEELNQDLGNYTDQQNAEAGDFSDLQGAAYSGIAAGQGGRSGDEKNAILRQDELDSLQQTEDEANSNYLTGAEEAGIRGDTGAAYSQLGKDEAGIDLASNNRDLYTRGQFNAGRDLTNQALDAQDAGVRGAVGRQRELSNATLGGEANNARKYLDPNALNTSSEYNNAYNFGDRDMQDIVDKAGRTVGYGATADEDRLLQDANAQGNTSPLALQAARNRIRQTGAVNSADAMTDARIGAKRLYLDTAQGKENTRLGAAQNYANLGTGTELNLGQDALSMQDTLGAAEIGAESYLGDQRLKTQQSLGQQGTQLEKDLGQSHIDIGTKGAEMNLAAGQAKDAANSARAGQIATNRQAATKTNQDTRYGRGMDIYGKESAANTDFSNARLGQEAEYRKTLADRQAQAAQGTQVGNQQRGANFGTQTSAINAAEGNAITNYKVPSATEKILGTIASLVPGAKGLMTPGPQRALIGERGPELEVNLAELPSYGYGFDPLNEEQQPDYIGGSGETAYEGDGLPGGTVSRNGKNPLWKSIINEITPGGYHPFAPPQTDEEPNYNPLSRQKHKGGVLGGLLSGGSLTGYADGGVVDGNEEIAPGINYIDHPQIKTLGENGPTAIVPLTRRPGNKLNPEDIPRLAEKYGSFKPMARGGMAGCGGYV